MLPTGQLGPSPRALPAPQGRTSRSPGRCAGITRAVSRPSELCCLSHKAISKKDGGRWLGWSVSLHFYGSEVKRGVVRRARRLVGCRDARAGQGGAAGSVEVEKRGDKSADGEATGGKTVAVWLGGWSMVMVMVMQALVVRQGGAEWKRPLLAVAFLASMLASAVCTAGLLPLLCALKAGQVVRKEGPGRHVLEKAGTPTMGGVGFVPAGVLLALLFSPPDPALTAVAGVTLGAWALGAWDDVMCMVQQSSSGVPPRVKLLVQLALASAFTTALLALPAPIPPALSLDTLLLPGGGRLILGVLFSPLAVFVITAESNAVNLTDGLDGLAAGTSVAALVGLAGVLLLMQTPHALALATFCICMAGAALGFLTLNHHPASVFMGDTGSLAIGAALGASAVAGGASVLPPLLLLTTLQAAEAVSVILQVSYFKATKSKDGVGRRIFRMAPFHHHLELSGWPEVKVVHHFYLW
eukprot:CAMPEP_0196591096 /NCGR_PEP_ID=MMETSP1081-20130531/68504_1 /TAXON_ID=36882 /ORGANISM="Pyramimonas amylifera, Strain CCMP720" /LENGTH=468 /DNA_ID=CAMNT_0041914363 /DNA_START=364 /DNA_END=1767 /DNA_ORIENTATION=+